MQNTPSSMQTTLFQVFILVTVCFLLLGIFVLRSINTSTAEADSDGIPHVMTVGSDIEFSQAEAEIPPIQ